MQERNRTYTTSVQILPASANERGNAPISGYPASFPAPGLSTGNAAMVADATLLAQANLPLV